MSIMSSSFVAAAEQVCLQPVLKPRPRRCRRNFAWQAIPHLCSSNRKGTTSDSWRTIGRNVKLFCGGGPEPASVRHVGDTCEWRRQVRWCGAMQCTIRQRRHLECNSSPDIYSCTRSFSQLRVWTLCLPTELHQKPSCRYRLSTVLLCNCTKWFLFN